MVVCHKLTDLYLFFMLTVFPLFTGFRGYAGITAAKFFCFAAATLLWASALCICSLKQRLHPPSLRDMRPASIAVLAYMALSCLSALLSPWFPDTLLGAGRWDGVVTLLLYSCTFLGVRRFGRLRAAHLYALGVSVLLCTAIALLQLLGWNPLGLFPGELNYFDAHIRYSGEFLGTIGNVDLLASLLCLSVPLHTAVFVTDGRHAPLLLPAAAGMFILIGSGVAGGAVGLLVCALVSAPVLLCSRGRLQRGLLAAAALAFAAFWALALHFAREGVSLSPGPAGFGALAACVLALLCAGILHLRRLRPEPEPAVYTCTLLCLASLTMLAGFVAVYFWPGESGTIYELSRILHGDIRDSFGSSRIRIWRETLALVPERPLLGGGPGSIAARLHIEFSRYVPETGKTLYSFVDNAHNLYLTVLTDSGIPGLLSYLTTLLLSLFTWIRRRAEHSFAPALGCALLCYWVADFFGLGLCLVAPILWLLWGLLEAKDAEHPDAPAGSSGPKGSG